MHQYVTRTIALCALLLASATIQSEPMALMERPYGPNAPWNVPVDGLPIHPESGRYSQLLWEDATANRPGNFNLTFDDYTYPVYYAADATDMYEVRVVRRWGNLHRQMIPWNPEWRAPKGTDAQIILLDDVSGYEWNLWRVRIDHDRKRVHAGNASLVQQGEEAGDGSEPGSFWTKENGFKPSRGCGIQYLAMLVRPEELAQGVIPHALSMPIINTDGTTFVPPATKLEHPGNPPGIPEGMRFALDVTDEEIAQWLAGLPIELGPETLASAEVIARALRDYGWFITDTSGGAHLQFEARVTAQAEWDALGLSDRTIGDKEYPRDLLDGLITQERIYVLVASDQYP